MRGTEGMEIVFSCSVNVFWGNLSSLMTLVKGMTCDGEILYNILHSLPKNFVCVLLSLEGFFVSLNFIQLPSPISYRPKRNDPKCVDLDWAFQQTRSVDT